MLVIVKKDQVSSFHQLFNTTLPGIELATEGKTDGGLPFLDVLVQNLPSEDFDGSMKTGPKENWS